MTRLVFGITVAGCVGLLGLSAWPGYLAVTLCGFPFVCIALPCFVYCVVKLFWLGLRDVVVRQSWWGLASFGILVVTVGLIALDVPTRIVFPFVAADLRGFVDAAPVDPTRDAHGGAPLDYQFGPYTVNRFAADRRGGVFFRTATAMGAPPDGIVYGFAFRPNSRGSPFGNQDYSQTWLSGEWYTFTVGDDY